MRLEKKCVPIYENPDASERCHVQILDYYISKLPKIHVYTLILIYMYICIKFHMHVNSFLPKWVSTSVSTFSLTTGICICPARVSH